MNNVLDKSKDGLLFKKHKIYISIDRENKVCNISDCIANEIDYSTQGRLVELASHISEKVESYMNIHLKDYGVKILDEEILMYELGEPKL